MPFHDTYHFKQGPPSGMKISVVTAIIIRFLSQPPPLEVDEEKNVGPFIQPSDQPPPMINVCD